jgi:hypothetical protein
MAMRVMRELVQGTGIFGRKKARTKRARGNLTFVRSLINVTEHHARKG